MSNLKNCYSLIQELHKLKLVFRNTQTQDKRQESTAEHSWSVAMIALILMSELKKEFANIDELKIIKMALIHDIVEIYAGDVSAFDAVARKNKEKVEKEALDSLISLNPVFGASLSELWLEFEEKKTVESQIAKACDAICPIFQRLQTKQSYIPIAIDMTKLKETKSPHFLFSKTFTNLFAQLQNDLISAELIK